MSFRGILHKYSEIHVAFEFGSTIFENVLVVIGGMTDGLLSVPFVPGLAHVLSPLDYSLIQLQMSSSFKGFGMSSLRDDVKEIKQLVEYLKSKEGGLRKRIIIMGHSTGSQDVIKYLLMYGSTVDAGIMQAPVSDREAFGTEIDPDELKKLNEHANYLVSNGKKSELLGSNYSKFVVDTPITAYRWCSLMIKGGDDDFFSSDLSSETLDSTFGQISKPFLIVYSEEDEFVPNSVDKPNLLNMWKTASNTKYWSDHSGFIKGASHAVPEEAAQQALYKMITDFLEEFRLL